MIDWACFELCRPRALRRNESPDLPGQRYPRRPSALVYSFPWVRSTRERALQRHPETLDLLRRHERASTMNAFAAASISATLSLSPGRR